MVSSLGKWRSDCFNSLWTGDRGKKTSRGKREVKRTRKERETGQKSKQTSLMRTFLHHFWRRQSATGTEAAPGIWIGRLWGQQQDSGGMKIITLLYAQGLSHCN